jgi:AraC family transcriptional regulator
LKASLEHPPERPRTSPSDEEAAWRDIVGTWRPLHGSIFSQGLSVEWHDFRLDHDMDWSRSFHRHTLEICLNFSGSASLNAGEGARSLGSNELALYTPHARRLKAARQAGTLHQFLTVELSADFLRGHFAKMLDRLKPAIRAFIENPAADSTHLEVLAMPASLLNSRVHFVSPPVPAHGRGIWYLGRVLEILAQTLFPPDDPQELFCERHLRASRERVDRACYLITRDLENPPSLDMLATEVGCSSFYLSRIFTEQTGVSIPKFLRMKRIEKAAELIRGGKMNITEAAFSVGYSSLSAFNKAFVEQFGCCPGLYPNVPIRGRKKRISDD